MRTRLGSLLCLGVGLAVLGLLAGCSSSSNGTGTYKRYFQALRESSGGLFSKPTLTRQQAAETPYASLGYRVDDGPQAMLVLATDSGGDEIWTASNHVVFQTRDGRLTRTVGLPHDRGALAPRSTEALLPPAAALKGPFSSTRMVDMPNSGIYSAMISCTTAAGRAEATRILGKAISTVRVNETCQAPDLGWQFTDSFWLDPESGMAWRSIQHLSPDGEMVEIEMLRPPG